MQYWLLDQPIYFLNRLRKQQDKYLYNLDKLTANGGFFYQVIIWLKGPPLIFRRYSATFKLKLESNGGLSAVLDQVGRINTRGSVVSHRRDTLNRKEVKIL